MKQVILSADGPYRVYSVPDAVADDLEKYCMEFCCHWLPTSPHASKYRSETGSLCYTEKDFIEYLNQWIFPEQRSELVEDLGSMSCADILFSKYADCPDFNF